MLFKLTHDIEIERAALSIALGVIPHAGVISCCRARDSLQDQALIGDNNPGLNVNVENFSLQKNSTISILAHVTTHVMLPLDFVDRRMSVDNTVKVDVCSFTYGIWIERSAQNYLRLRGIWNTSSNYSRKIAGNCRLVISPQIWILRNSPTAFLL